jgi:hypothetical protein
MSQVNELDWKKYEAITKYIYETLGQEFGVKVIGFGERFKITGRSGVSHQIDVLTSNSDGIHTYRTAIECKYWKEKITKDIVMKVSGVIDDCGINKGVIVSKNGYTQDCYNFARHKNIELVELKESEGKDVNGMSRVVNIGILGIQIRSTITRPEILKTIIEYGEKIRNEKEEINIYNCTIILSNGNHIPFTEFTKAFQDELHHQGKLFQLISKKYETNGASFLNKKTNASVKIKGIIFTGVLKKIDKNSDLKFSIVDQVWLIMKSIFDERTFTITENGLIVEEKQ